MRIIIFSFFAVLLCLTETAGEELSSREYAIAVDKALKDNPGTYPHELVEKCTAAAIKELNECKPDPGVVAKLAALPDNTWLEMNTPGYKGTPANHHSFPRGRGEGSAVYDAKVKGMVCWGGCGAPQYSSDMWVYRTGANRWFEVWPNVPKPDWKKIEKAGKLPKDRPYPGCTLGLAYASLTTSVYRYTCANTGKDSLNVWQTDVLTGTWRIAGRGNSAGGVRIVEDPVLAGLLAVPPWGGTQLFSFKKGKWSSITKDGPKTTACHALTYIPKHKYALLVTARPGDEKTSFGDGKPREVQTWLFHSQTRKWEQIKTTKGPEWYYRGGITYDSANDTVLFGGWKTNDPGNGPNVTPGLWAFDAAKKKWSFTKPASGPRGRYEYFAYDPEYNVTVTAANGHGTWVYRYKRKKTGK
ncbi:hypothetical protein ACFL6F_00690 [Planctomycetota bacterium]